MPSSVYLQTRHKKITGLVNAARAAKCFNCGGLSRADDMFKGWCLPCVNKWKATADHGMLAQVARGYSPDAVLPQPTPQQMQRIHESVVEPKNDEDFIPLVLFRGNPTVGRVQSYWNLLKAMQHLELRATVDVFKLGVSSHDTLHACGLHAPVQRCGLSGFLSRLMSSPDFKPFQADKHLRDYISGFIQDNRLLVYRLDRIARQSVWSKQAWRRIPKVKFEPLATHWPFLHTHSEETNQLVMIDRLVPREIPEQWRQDMCQDLVVALLSGEVTVENIRDNVKKYITKVWQLHPIKYGPLSLDAPPPWRHDDSRTLGELISNWSDESDDNEPFERESDSHELAHLNWHEGFNRPAGLTRLGDLLRFKNDGRAIK